MQVEEVIDALTSSLRITTRVKLRDQEAPSAWSQMFVLPVRGYIEISAYGPVPKRDIEWVELDPVEIWHIGRLLPPKYIDHTAAIYKQLQRHGVALQLIDGLIRVTP